MIMSRGIKREFVGIRKYIEENPVRAALVRQASEYHWSSAGWATRGSPADRGSAPLSIQICEHLLRSDRYKLCFFIL